MDRKAQLQQQRELRRLHHDMELEMQSLQVARQELELQRTTQKHDVVESYRREANEVNRKLAGKVKALSEDNDRLLAAVAKLTHRTKSATTAAFFAMNAALSP